MTLVVLLFSFLFVFYVVAKLRSILIDLLQEVQNFFNPVSESEPSPFAKTVDMAGQVIGNQVGQAVSQVLNGSLGGSLKSANAELQERALIEHPEVAQKLAFQDLLPRSTKKNSLANFMMQKIFDMAINAGPGKNGPGTYTSGNSPKFKF